MKYLIWIKEKDSHWEEQGDGPLTTKQAKRIAGEIRRECPDVTVRILPEHDVPA